MPSCVHRALWSSITARCCETLVANKLCLLAPIVWKGWLDCRKLRLKNQQTAEELSISDRTVNAHASRELHELGLRAPELR